MAEPSLGWDLRLSCPPSPRLDDGNDDGGGWKTHDDVLYRVHPSAMTVVTRSVAALPSGAERIMTRPYPPPTLAEVA